LASGDAQARFRLQLFCGDAATNGVVQDLPPGGSVTYQNQQLAGGDWRYYRVPIPLDAPESLVINWTNTQGSPHLFIRDTAPPGDGPFNGQYYNYNLNPYAAISWATDAKDQGPYPDFATAGSYTLTTPPLRPGSVYYLGFWSPDDATFSVGCQASSATIELAEVVGLYQEAIAGTVPAFGSLQYRIDVPAEAGSIVLNASNSSNLVLSIEQGTLALPGGPAHWVSSGTNSGLNQALTGVWPWLAGRSYYLTVTNMSASAGSFSLTWPDLFPSDLGGDSTAVPGQPFNIWFSVTNGGTGPASSPYGYWYDQVTLSTNTTLAGAVASWNLYYSGGLAAGQSYTVTNSLTAPNLAAGQYYLIVQADAGNYVAENNKANNPSAAAAIAFVAPDLVAESASSAPVISFGGSVSIVYSVENAGNETAVSPAGFWQDQVALSTNGTAAGALETWTWPFYGTLSPGSTYTVTNTVQLPVLVPGVYDLILTADVSNQVEGNSGAGNQLAVAPGLLYLAAPPVAPSPVFAGQKLGLSIPTLAGATYALEATDNLAQPVWFVVASAIGDGASITLQDSATPLPAARFYRIRLTLR
jgi:hypothetical protein